MNSLTHTHTHTLRITGNSVKKMGLEVLLEEVFWISVYHQSWDPIILRARYFFEEHPNIPLEHTKPDRQPPLYEDKLFHNLKGNLRYMRVCSRGSDMKKHKGKVKWLITETNLDFPEIFGDFPKLFATFWGEVAKKLDQKHLFIFFNGFHLVNPWHEEICRCNSKVCPQKSVKPHLSAKKTHGHCRGTPSTKFTPIRRFNQLHADNIWQMDSISWANSSFFCEKTTGNHN